MAKSCKLETYVPIPLPIIPTPASIPLRSKVPIRENLVFPATASSISLAPTHKDTFILPLSPSSLEETSSISSFVIHTLLNQPSLSSPSSPFGPIYTVLNPPRWVHPLRLIQLLFRKANPTLHALIRKRSVRPASRPGGFTSPNPPFVQARESTA